MFLVGKAYPGFSQNRRSHLGRKHEFLFYQIMFLKSLSSTLLSLTRILVLGRYFMAKLIQKNLKSRFNHLTFLYYAPPTNKPAFAYSGFMRQLLHASFALVSLKTTTPKPSFLVDIHVRLPAEPLLTGAAVLDVLKDFGEHCALQALLLAGLFEPVIRSCTCAKKTGIDTARQTSELPQAADPC